MRLGFARACAALTIVVSACEDPSLPPDAATSSAATTAASAGTGGSGGAPPPDPSAICTELGLEVRPISSGPYGARRGEIAEPFVVPLADGTTWSLAESWSGCETYVFSIDRIPVSEADPTSIWVEQPEDLRALLDASPRNTHYFFVSRAASDAAAAESTAAMQARVDGELAAMDPADAAQWRPRLHVVAGRAQDLEGWLGDALVGIGRIGMVVDRDQRIRGVGYLADVERFKGSLESQGLWPWENNLAYLAHEAAYANAQDARLAPPPRDATVVELWNGEILQQFAETTVDLPSAAEMQAFDTFEVEVEMSCPDPEQIEIGNCGAWDYLAHLYVKDGLGADVELARFITAYHRETHWRVDVTPMMAHLLAGGSRTFKWQFAPEWNPQPTATALRLVFSNRGKGYAPREATFLYAGGPFGSAYNTGRVPASVPIPADAARVELWALTTGHGMAAQNCAEFCNHQHEFSIDGAVHVQEFPDASTETGCVPAHEHGMVPNQAGTWWFGRGGWCPGQQVDPWVVDVTADVTPGSDAVVAYEGLLGGAQPPDGAGDIVLSSYLVVYK